MGLFFIIPLYFVKNRGVIPLYFIIFVVLIPLYFVKNRCAIPLYFIKKLYLYSGLLLSILNMDFGGSQPLTELILAGAADDLVNKGGLAEMMLGWELVKYSNPRSQHDLYYWENVANGTSSEIDYVIVRNMKVMPIECKAGTSGRMKSLRLFMRNKHLNDAYRCSLENFALLENQDVQDDNAVRRIAINPLYAISNLCKQ